MFRPSEKDLASVCGHSKGYRQSLVQNTLKDAVTAVENAAEEEKTILAEVKTKCETLLAKIDEDDSAAGLYQRRCGCQQ